MDKNADKVKAGKTGGVAEKESLPIFVKYGLIALAVVVVIAIGLVIWFSVAGSTVGSVGGEKISTAEFKYYLDSEKQTMLQDAQSVNPNLSADTYWKTKINGEDPKVVAKKQALDSIKTLKIQLIKAKENKISLTSDEIKSLDNNIQTQIIQPYGSVSKVKANKLFQAQYGITLDDFRKIQIENYTVQKYLYDQMSKVTVPDADIKKAYDDDPSSYDKVTVRQILFLYAGKDGKRTKDASKKLADDTLAKINTGADMTALADQLSEDTGVTTNHGEYTVTKFDSYVAEFLDWSLKAKVGDTAVVESSAYGYHVMKCEKRESQTFDAVKAQIKSQLVQDKFTKDYSAQMDTWKKDPKYNVKTNSNYDSIT